MQPANTDSTHKEQTVSTRPMVTQQEAGCVFSARCWAGALMLSVWQGSCPSFPSTLSGMLPTFPIHPLRDAVHPPHSPSQGYCSPSPSTLSGMLSTLPIHPLRDTVHLLHPPSQGCCPRSPSTLSEMLSTLPIHPLRDAVHPPHPPSQGCCPPSPSTLSFLHPRL